MMLHNIAQASLLSVLFQVFCKVAMKVHNINICVSDCRIVSIHVRLCP